MGSIVTDKNYLKVFILYLLKNIDRPLEYSTINDVVLYDGAFGYIDFATCFVDMLDDELLVEIKGADGEQPRYAVTKKGVTVADALSDGIFEDIRSRSLKTALRLVSFRERGVEFEYKKEEIPEDDGGGILVTCTLREKKRTVCSVTIKVDSPSRAEMIKKNFNENPENIYKGSLALLSGDANLFF